MFGKVKLALIGSKKTTMIGVLIAAMAAAGVANEEAKVIAEATVGILLAIGFFLSKDGDK